LLARIAPDTWLYNSPMQRVYIGVVVCEVLVIAALWAFGRAFA
jgi:hypothetical protein